MSGNTVGLYGAGTSTANIAGGNVTGLYQQTQAVEVDNGYNDADVQAFLESYTGNIQCGNIEVLNSANVNAIYTDGYYYANGTPIDIGVNAYSNANVAAFLPTYTGNLAGGNLILTTSAYVGANVTVTNNLTTGQNITAGGYIQAAGNIRTTGVSGNITGADYVVSNFFVGDGGLLSNVAGSYANANVEALLASGTITGNIITTGNVSGTYFLGNGSQLTGLPATYGNANVATFLANFGSNTITTTGNIQGGYILGNGSQLTGLPATYSNADVATFLANFGSNTIVTTGNITGGNFIGSGATLTNLPGGNVSGQVANALVAGTVYTAAQPNITSVGTLSTLSVTGNIAGGNISATGNITVSGSLNSDDITSSNVTVYGDQVITGNLTVQGTTTTINSNVVTTNDKTFTVANNQSTGANIDGAGFEAGNIGGSGLATWLYSAPSNSWQSNINITPISNLALTSGTNSLRWADVYTGNVDASGNITGSNIIGNGQYLTNLTGANVTGTVANAAYATDSAHSTVADSANSVAGGNVSGQVANALVAGTVYTAAQPNITSVGTLSTLAVTGNIVVANGAGNIGLDGYGSVGLYSTSANVPVYLGSLNSDTFIGANPLYGAFMGSEWNGATGNFVSWKNNVLEVGLFFGGSTLKVNGQANITGNITSSANISGSYILGNGSQLTGLPATYNDSNVTTLLASLGSNVISSTANITTTANIAGGNLLTSGNIYGNTAKVYTDVNGFAAYGSQNSASGAYVTNGTGNILIGGHPSLGVLLMTKYGEAGTTAVAFQDGNLWFNPIGAGSANIRAVNVIEANGNITTGGNIGAINNIFTVSGSIVSGNVTYARTDGTAGQVLTTYGNGQTYFSTVSGGSYGDSNVTTLLASLGSNTINSTANITTTGNISGGNILGNGYNLTGINSFGNIAVTGQTTVSADNATDTLTLVAGTNITITTDAANNKITITSSGSAAVDTLSPFLLMGG